MNDKTVNVELTGELSYSQQVSMRCALKVINVIVNFESGSEQVSYEHATDEFDSSHEFLSVESPRQAIEQSKAQNNKQKIVALAAYLLQQGGSKTFTPKDVLNEFPKAAEPVPKNFSRDWRNVLASSWIVEDPSNKGEFYLTSAVRSVLSDGFVFPKSSSVAHSKPVRQLTVPKTLIGMEFSGTMDGYLSYSKLTKEKDRILWILQYMKDKNKRDALVNGEISYISQQIGTPIPNNNISGDVRWAKEQGLVVRTSKKQIRITEEGSKYLCSLSTKKNKIEH